MSGDAQGLGYSASEMMTVAASRQLSNDDVCLVGIGAPSKACNLARATHAPEIKLIYESGTIGCRPEVFPLSIGDGELCDTSLVTVSLPEMFRYWLQAGRISVGFLGGAEIDRYANLNTTVIGDYHHPKVRLPGAGGAPEIATGCEVTYVIIPMDRRRFVDKLAFRTTLGHDEGYGSRRKLGVTTGGPAAVITDLCILKPAAESRELEVASIHPGVTREHIISQCGWELRFRDDVGETPPPTDIELSTLRKLQERTDHAHANAL